MAAYAALASLMNNIEQMMNHPHLSPYFDDEQIQALLEKSDSLLDFIESNKYGEGSEEAEDFERQITHAAHAAEDIIETHIVDLIQAGVFQRGKECYRFLPKATEGVIESPLVEQFHAAEYGETSSSFLLDVKKGSKKVKNKVRKWVRRITSTPHVTRDVIDSPTIDQIHTAAEMVDLQKNIQEMIDLQSIIEEMEALTDKANEVMKIEREERPPHSTHRMEIGKDAAAMVGLDDELTHLLDELTGHQSNRHTISIVGMGGMGKTTLARNIYANPLIIEHFDIRAWATVSQQYDVKEILSQLLSNLGISTSKNVDGLEEQLHKGLIGRRYLVILDDIWSVEAWDKVRHYFPDDGNSSRVLLTTRLSNVASACGSTCFTMNLLDEGKSWELFCSKASFPHKDDPLQLDDLGKEIVRSCKGLALSIVVIGGLLLKSPRTIGYWEDVAKNLKSIPDSEEKQESLDVLYLSYRQLPPHLKPCFLYMGSFKEDSEIRVSTVTKLWVAEGFIRPNGTRILEDIAHDRLKDLIDRNLIYVRRRRANGEMGSCGIHDLLRDLCIKVAEQQDFFHVREYGKMQTTDRRIVCDVVEYINSRLSRSILSEIHFVESIKCKLLRVLGDAQNTVSFYMTNEVVGDTRADSLLYENVNLRYLAYQGPYRTKPKWELPVAVSFIWNIQTLMISRSGVTVVAPYEVWKMRQLRHIKVSQIYLPRPRSSDIEVVLESLLTLATAVNLRLSEEVCKIIPNITKLGLKYNTFLEGYNGSLTSLCNLDRFLKLQSLKMEFDIYAPDYELHKKLAFPGALRKLSLSRCQLHWNALSMIGSLPQLQVLHLGFLCVTEGEQWSPVDGQFSKLKFLKIEQCHLHDWKAASSHFPVLEKLVLNRLGGLKEIPILDIGEIPTLGLIRVYGCSLSAAISAIRIKEYQQELENEALQIQIVIKESEAESFMQMLLSAKASDVEEEIKNAELSSRKKRKREVEEWLEEVKSIENEVVELKMQVESEGLITRLTDGGKVAKLNDDVEGLIEQSRCFGELLLDVCGTKGDTFLTNGMVGEAFNDNLERILELLEMRQVSRIGVYGMGGVGKTTLAMHINNRLVQQSQGPVLWVTVSQEFSITSLQEKLARLIRVDLSDEDSDGKRAAILHRALSTMKNSVLIFDDVWENIDFLKVGCPVSKDCCRLIITTRSLKVCRQIHCQREIAVKKLDEDEAWKLFDETLGNEEGLGPQVEEIAKSVAKMCDGLPLGIITVAGSMRGERAVHTWKNASRELKERVVGQDGMNEEIEVFKVLKYSFDRLNMSQSNEFNTFQLCFLCCSLYPEDCKILEDNLVRKFISEGLVDQRKSRRAQIHQAHSILDKLVNVCLLEAGVGFEEYVKMHDLVRGMALMVSEGKYMVRSGDYSLKEIPEEEEWTEGVEKVSLMMGGIKTIGDGTSPNCPKLTTLIFAGSPLHAIPNSFFSRMQCLRTLDLCETDITTLPDSIGDMKSLKVMFLEYCYKLEKVPYLGKLKALRELNLSATAIKEVPQGLEELLNLKFLSLDAEGLEILPRGLLLELKHLQHVNIPLHIEVPIEELENLTQLEEFSGRVKSVDDFNRYITSRVHDTCYKIGVGLLHTYRHKYFEVYNNELILCDVDMNDEKVLGRDVSYVTIRKCEGLSVCFVDDLSRLDNPTSLKRVRVQSCGGIESILSSEQGLQSKISSLEQIELVELEDFKWLIKKEEVGSSTSAQVVFTSLRRLVISKCKTVMKLGLSISAAPNLEYIQIEECREMEEIFEDDGRGPVTLPRLKELSLHELPRVTSLCKAAIVCNSITSIEIVQCPSLLKKLPVHMDVRRPPPTLRVIRVSGEWWESLEWDDPDIPQLLHPFLHLF